MPPKNRGRGGGRGQNEGRGGGRGQNEGRGGGRGQDNSQGRGRGQYAGRGRGFRQDEGRGRGFRQDEGRGRGFGQDEGRGRGFRGHGSRQEEGRGRGFRQGESRGRAFSQQEDSGRGFRQEEERGHGFRRDDDSDHEQWSQDEDRGSGTDRGQQKYQADSAPIQHELSVQETKEDKKAEVEDLGIELKYKMLISPLFPRKPPTSKYPPGKVIKLISNCFKIDLPGGNVYHYDVEIVSKRMAAAPTRVAQIPALQEKKKYRCMSTKRNREVIDVMLRGDSNFRGMYAAFDGRKNLYTKTPLNIPSFPLLCDVRMPSENPDDTRTDDFVVHIQPVEKKDTSTCAINLDSLTALFEGCVSTVNQDAVMAVETILRHKACQRYFPVGRSFFYPPLSQDHHPLSGGKEIWFGYHQSLRLGQWKPMVNLDITATAFYQKGPVLNYIADFMGVNLSQLDNFNLSDGNIKKMSNILKTMRIEVTHLPYRRKYRIWGFTRDRADRLRCEIETNGVNQVMTVAEYFRRTYNKMLRYPHLPCIQVNPPNKKIYLPVEVCELIEGQHCRSKLEGKDTTEMIKFTARSPKQRFDEIRDVLKRADYNNDEYLKEFGFRVYNEPLKLEGRVLGPPSICYNNQSKITPYDGSWDMRGKQFLKGAVIEKWVFLNFGNPRFYNDEAMKKFAKLLVDIAYKSGISIDRPEFIGAFDRRRVSVQKVLSDMKSKYNATLAVIAISELDKAIYGEIKTAAETVLGLSTQCVKEFNVKKCKPDLVSNLCQKINAKMGGVNNSLVSGETPQILHKPVLIIGADVTHPSPTSGLQYSIAAAVGSLDAHPSRYAVTCRAQKRVDEKKQAVEVILDLKSMVVELLKAFRINTRGKKPEKIIFYRDGVSEGQFDIVRDHEIKSIREACRSVEAGYEPGITFLVVQKRHHVRFMPQDMRDGVGKMKNIPPGTTVDNTVVHPLNFDFFLCSHFGLQGTSRPCHYTVLADDNDFTADDLHKLTYYLCHTFARCTKSISCPAPVQYAHLAAYRARHYAPEESASSRASTDSSASTTFPLDVINNSIKVIDTMENTMYFV